MADMSDNDASPAGKKRKRSRTGCLNCRRRRKLCDERRPGCVRCERMGEDCAWPAAFSFRESGWQGKFDTTVPGAESKGLPASGQLSPSAPGSPLKNGRRSEDSLNSGAPSMATSEQIQSLPPASDSLNVSTPSNNALAMPGLLPAPFRSPLESPDAFIGYYPNAEYRHLHATLYDVMVDTAKESGDVTRQGTPDRSQQVPDAITLNEMPQKQDPIRPDVEHMLPNGITFVRERELWASYLDEISPWLDSTELVGKLFESSQVPQ